MYVLYQTIDCRADPPGHSAHLRPCPRSHKHDSIHGLPPIHYAPSLASRCAWKTLSGEPQAAESPLAGIVPITTNSM